MKVSKITKFLAKKCPLGIDLDSKNQFRLLKVYFNAKYVFKNAKIEIFETKHGYHVKVHVPTNIYHRCGLGDDPNRIYLSELRGGIEWADDVMFDCKNGYWVEKIDERSLLSSPFWNIPGRPIKGKRLKRRWKYEQYRT